MRQTTDKQAQSLEFGFLTLEFGRGILGLGCRLGRRHFRTLYGENVEL